MFCIFKFSVFFVLGFTCVDAEPRDFLRKVSSQEIAHEVETSLASLFSGHASDVASKRHLAIEGSIWQTFQSLPKNTMGRLAPPAVRYIVHGYFAREHGWQIKGLDSDTMQLNASATRVQDVHILQDKAPLLVEGLLEAKHQNHGLALTDVVAMISVLERLVFDESATLLEAAYHLNGESTLGSLDEEALHKVFKSYLVLFGQGSKADLTDAARHQAILAARPREDIDDFESNAVLNFNFANRHTTNPFVPRKYSFGVASTIVEDLAQRYGKWQNAECRDMKAHLAELDPEASGRVPLGLLYAQPASASYHFSESVEYLRKIGALDETTSTPKVLIANYITGPSNCIASSSYYSVCCLNNCNSIMDEIEHKVLAPTASPERLLGIVRNISSQQAALPAGLSDKLQAIAERHGGQVPLHGRLFAQWLHFAFPHECPFPSILESADMLATSQWHSTQYAATDEERMNHVMSATISAVAEDTQVDELWSDYEVLPALDEPKSHGRDTLATMVRGFVQLAAVALGLRSLIAAWNSGIGKNDKKNLKKNDDLVFGFSV